MQKNLIPKKNGRKILTCFIRDHSGVSGVWTFSDGRPSCGGHGDLLVGVEASKIVLPGGRVHHDHDPCAIVVVHVEVVAEDQTVGGAGGLPVGNHSVWTIRDE